MLNVTVEPGLNGPGVAPFNVFSIAKSKVCSTVISAGSWSSSSPPLFPVSLSPPTKSPGILSA